jgi:UDP-glucose 4-epimerase
MKVLVTGGAGYIGSVTARVLLARGHDVEILDDFSTGHREALPPGIRLHEGSLLDAGFVDRALAAPCDAVLHFAAFSLVAESVDRPLPYYRNNVGGSVNLLDAAARAGVRRFVFSSTAAVYGEPDEMPITEHAPTRPVNPYGHTKLAIEWALADTAAAAGFPAVALRYFNACGATAELGEDHDPETHLIPRLLLSVLDPGFDFAVFGDDYPTPDGTCIRDYIHVADLAEAHALALEADVRPGLSVYNLGSESGASVREILKAAEAVTGRALDPRIEPRRPGDPARLVAGNARARRELGWRPRCSDLPTILADAWNWHRAHPRGYRG